MIHSVSDGVFFVIGLSLFCCSHQLFLSGFFLMFLTHSDFLACLSSSLMQLSLRAHSFELWRPLMEFVSFVLTILASFCLRSSVIDTVDFRSF